MHVVSAYNIIIFIVKNPVVGYGDIDAAEVLFGYIIYFVQRC